jgi:hypothetical protein
MNVAFGEDFRLGTISFGCSWIRMPRYFFHLAGVSPARDRVGHECANDRQAEEDARSIAQRYGVDRPRIFRDNDFISVTKADGEEIAHVPLTFTLF